jgi:alpha-L-rhamnosidase
MAIGVRRRGWRRLSVLVVVALASATYGSVPQAAVAQARLLAGHQGGGASLTPQALRVDALPDPLGLGDASPSLSWSLSSGERSGSQAARQTAYEIRVASTSARLDRPDLWDSGKVTSSDTGNVAYGGAPLRSREAAAWAVRVWDGAGRASAWSAPGTWETGLLRQSDWSAKWIEDPGYSYATNGVPNPLPVFAKPFEAGRRITRARLYITGLGQYTAQLNGRPVTRAVLEPGQTSYWAEVDYRTYDVTGLLRPGANVLGIQTGSGVYQQADSTSTGRYMFQPGNNTVLGVPKVIAQLEVTYADGARQTIATDPSWLTALGPTMFSSWWGGEDYDARRIPANWAGHDPASRGWQHAALATLTATTIPAATTPLVANPRPPVTVASNARPVTITKVTPPSRQHRARSPRAARRDYSESRQRHQLVPGRHGQHRRGRRP